MKKEIILIPWTSPTYAILLVLLVNVVLHRPQSKDFFEVLKYKRCPSYVEGHFCDYKIFP